MKKLFFTLIIALFASNLFASNSQQDTTSVFATKMEAYNKINEYSGFDLKSWIVQHMDWENDFRADTLRHFREADLLGYLSW